MLTERLQSILNNMQTNHLLRERIVLESPDENQVIVADQSYINFCSSDYLHLARHPSVVKAYQNAANIYGLGSTASAAICGFTKPHALLEEKFAEFLKRDKAILFNSGYHANLGVLSTFADRHSVIISDKLCHASLIDGMVLSRAKQARYPHLNVARAEALLNQHRERECLLVTESLFSMEGDVAPVKQLAALAANTNALLIVDDAHGVGVLGEQGGGICDALQLTQRDIPILVTPLGKAIGSFGAIVSGSHDIIEALLQCARTYRYSTAYPPAVAAATIAALNVLIHESWRRLKLREVIRFFIREAKARELPVASWDETPIKSIVIGSNQKTIAVQKKLSEKKFLVSCIRPPTVPINRACIRISLNCMHRETEIIQLLDTLKATYDKHD